jgi:hypothetical protein
MSECRCRVLKNGVPDVFGFGIDASGMVAVHNVSANVLEVCDAGHKVEPGQVILVDPALPLIVSNRKGKRLILKAEFNSKGQISKSK